MSADAGVRIARNAGLKLAVQATRLLSLALVVATARTVGPAEFGKFTFAYALATILGVAVDFGIPATLTRAVARAPGSTAERWATAGTLKVALLGLAVPVYLAVPLLGGRGGDVLTTVWLLGLAIALQALIENAVAVFTGFQRLEHEVLVRMAEKIALVVGGVAALGFGWGIRGIAAAFAGAAALSLTLATYLIHRRLAPLRLGWHGPAARGLARELAPLAQAQLLAFATTRLPAVLVALLAGDQAAGFFGAAFRVYDVVLVAPVALVAAVYPELARTPSGDPRFRALARQGLTLLLLAALPVALALVVGARWVTDGVYGPGYAAAAPVLALLGVAVGLAMLQMFLTMLFLACDRPRRLRVVTAVAFVASVGLTPVLIGRGGAAGGAAAVLVVEAVGVVGALIALRGVCGLPLARGAAKGLAAAAIGAGAATLVPAGGVRLVAAVAGYAIGLIVLRPVPAAVCGRLVRGVLGRPGPSPAPTPGAP
jgi:O-antigen/teichoic acid export membrane protein